MTVGRRAPSALRRLLFPLAIAIGIGVVLAWSALSPTAAQQPRIPVIQGGDFSPRLQALCLDGGQAAAIRHPRTGAVRFVGTEPGRPITGRARTPGISPEAAARAYLNECGELFGVSRQADQLSAIRSETMSNEHRSVVRFQQRHNGVPVIGGELLVHLDDAHNILAVAGKALPGTTLATVPTIDAATAARNAVATVAKVQGLAPEQLTATPPQLSIYNPMMIGPESGPTTLVWRTEVTPRELLPIRELVLVDAHRGSISLHFNQVDTALNRQTYTAGNTTTLPGTLVCNESDPTCAAGDSHAAAAHLYGADTYNFYQANHGRNSIDNLGMAIKQTVHYSVNYSNAFWNGAQMVFGDGAGFPLADDVVGHELTHGVTQYTSNLFYYYQSGAINESLSDVFGEFIDQTNGHGTDTPAVKWLLGEDVTGLGAIRSMSNPPAFSDPDKMTSAFYYQGAGDNGGVHTNSGINNKAAFLMVDGGTFNGQTISGLGITKVAKIYYEAQTHLLTSGSDYRDLYDALYQGCNNLLGTAGIVTTDCQEVRKATLAVEMNGQPVPNFNTDAPVCAAGQTPVNTFFDDLESGAGNWVTITPTGTLRWSYGSPYGAYAHSGHGFLYADDYPAAVADSAVAMASGVAIPANAFLRFAHAFGFDAPNHDGGVVEYSTNNGTTWVDAGSLIDFNGYGGTVPGGTGNPLAGRSAFLADSHGYISSRLNLASLSGQSVRFRWRMGLDSSIFNWGWWLDDVQIYTCAGAGFTGSISGTVTNALTGTAVSGVTVQLYSNAGVFLSSATTNGSGAYTLGSLDAGTYFARTTNTSGLIDKLYNDITCVACDVTTGTPIFVASGTPTNNINFALTSSSPTLTVSATTVAPGSSVTVTLTNGQGGATDWLGFAATGTPSTSYSNFSYAGAGVTTRTWTVTTPATTGTYEFRLFSNNGYTRLATSPIVTVSSIPPNPFAYVVGRRTGGQVVSVIGTAFNAAVARFPAGIGCFCVGADGVAVSPNGSRAYVTNELSNSLTVIDTSLNSVLSTVTVGSGPTSVRTSADGTRAYVLNGSSPTSVSVLDATTNNVLTTIPLGVIQARGMALRADGQRLFVSTYGSNTVLVIDTTLNTILATIQVGSLPQGLDVSADGSRVYVANLLGSTVSVIDTATNAVVATVPVGTYPSSVRLTPDGRRAWVPNNVSGTISVIDTQTNTVATTLSSFSGPNDVAFSASGSRAYVAGYGFGVYIVDTVTGVRVGSIPFDTAFDASPMVIAMAPAVNPTPAVSGLSPTSVAATSAAFTLTVTGTGFASTSTVQVDGATRPTTFGTATQVTAAIPATDVAAVGSHTIRVVTPAPGGGTSNGVTLYVTPPPGVPLVSNLNPAVVAAGGPAFALTVTGTDFAGNSVVRVNGVARPTVFGSATQLTATIPASDIAAAWTPAITVMTPAPGGGTSNALPLTVTGPTLTVTPPTTVAPGTPVTVTLTFGQGGAADWLALAPCAAADVVYQQFMYVGAGIATRTWTVPAPSALGCYEFRLFSNNSYTRLATSPPVNVAPGITITDVSVAEGDSGTTNAVFTVSLSAASPQPVTVDYATADGTATAGSDYAATNGTLTFPAGTLTQTITVFVNGDTTFEPNETFVVNLTNAGNALIADAQGVGAITNDDVGPTLTINNVSQLEGDSGTTNFVFTVTLASPPASGTVTVDWATANGTAAAGSDYVAANGMLTFAQGAPLTQTVTVVVNGDTAVEPSETFFVNLSNASSNAVIGTPAQGVGTITNDDGPRLTVSASNVLPGATVTATLANGLGGATDWMALAACGAADVAYSQFMYVGAGVVTRTWTVTPPMTMGCYEFRLFSNNSYMRLAASPSVNVVPGITISDVSMTEGNSGSTSAVFTVSLSAASPQTVTVDWATADGTATAGSDYTSTTGTLTFAPGVLTRTIPVSVLGDTAFEPNETFVVSLANASNALITDPQGVGTITNDDVGPTLTVNSVSQPEGDSGTTNFVFTVTLANPPVSGSVTVDWATANGTATTGSDYVAANGTLTFAQGAPLTQTATVVVNGDTTGEPNETFVVNLSNASVNAAIGTPSQGVGTIVNDDGPRLTVSAPQVGPGASLTATLTNGLGGATDWLGLYACSAADVAYSQFMYVGAGVAARTWTVAAPTMPGCYEFRLFSNNSYTRLATSPSVNVVPGLTITDVTQLEGNSGATNSVFTVSLSAASPLQVTVDWATGNGTATAGSDYVAANGTLTFPAGTLTQTIPVSVTGDTTFEPDETFVVNLSNASNALIADAQGLGTIKNDDVGPTLTVNNVSQPEGDSGTSNFVFAVTLANPPVSGTVTVDWATANGTATAGSDYVAVNGTLTFPVGTVTQTATVVVNGDTTGEPNETFFVNLTNASTNAATGTPSQGIGTITNDDGPRLTLTPPPYSPGQSVTATLTNGLGGATDWLALARTTDPDTSYVQFTYVGAGVTTRTWTVQMPAAPGNYEFRLFSNNTYNRLATSPAASVVPGITITDVSVAEGNSGTTSAVFTARLSAATAQTVTVDYATADGTATAGSDYAAKSGTLTFPAGTLTQTITVSVNGDATFEPNETFVVNLANASNALIADPQGVGTITNDDVGPTLTINNVSQPEGDSGTSNFVFTVTLANPPGSGTVTVDWATANGTATAGSDYVAANGTLTFPVGTVTQTVTVVVNGDTAGEPNETFLVNLSNVSSNAAIGPPGQGVGTITNDDGPRLTVSSTTPTAGSTVCMTLTNAPGGAFDWLAFTLTGSPNTSYVQWNYVVNLAGGQWCVPVPSTVGAVYEFRLFVNNGFTPVATSPTMVIAPAAGPSLIVNTQSLAPGTLVTATLSSGTGLAGDFMTLAISGTVNTSYVRKINLASGVTARTWTVPVPSTAGSYEFRFFSNNGATRLATSPVVTASGTACVDTDGDGICDIYETNTHVYVSPSNTGTSPTQADTDGDGIKDGDEVFGAAAGLDLPGLGANPLRKNIFLEYDWVDDNNDPGSCVAHTHRPTQAMLDRVTAAFASASVSNPDGSTGITMIHDYGQGGLFTGGNLASHAGNITGGVNGADFQSMKAANFATNRQGYFHYVAMAHWYTDSLGSSGQAELPGNDLIVSLGCFVSTTNVANTIMHELGHNLFLQHGGNESCNWKPNYNSVMNYRFQFPGIDTSCNAVGSSGESNVLDYSRGTRISLNENNLNESAGVCGATPIDWNFDGAIQNGLVYDLNRTSATPNGSTPADSSSCSAVLMVLNDFNDWANVYFLGLSDVDGARPATAVPRPVVDCNNPNMPRIVPLELLPPRP